MMYKRLPDIEFPWTFEKLLELPLFMREEVYKTMDEFIEEERKIMNAIRNR